MNRSRLLFLLVSVAVLGVIGAGTLSRAAAQSDDGDSLYKYLSVFTEVFNLVRKTYVEEADVESLIAGALDGASDALDPFSTFVPAAEVEAYATYRQVGPWRSGVTVAQLRGITYVAGVLPSSPAAQSGVEVGDIVSEMDGRSTRTLPLWRIQQVLSAEAGKVVGMELLRQGQPVTVEITLGEFDVDRLSETQEQGITALRPVIIDADAAVALLSRLRELTVAEVNQLIIDLRDVAEGTPDAAYEIAGYFAQGALGELRSRAGSQRTFESEAAPVWDGELVVLVDRGTLGAAEILARVLQHSQGARLVGQPTFGYAGEQDFIAVANGSQLWTTTAFYAGPDGVVIDRAVEPDELVDGRRGFGENAALDRILRRGTELLRAAEEDGELR